MRTLHRVDNNCRLYMLLKQHSVRGLFGSHAIVLRHQIKVFDCCIDHAVVHKDITDA